MAARDGVSSCFRGIGSAGHGVSYGYIAGAGAVERAGGDSMRASLNALIAGLAWCFSVPSLADARLQFDLQQYSLTAALKEWAHLSALQLVYLAPDVTKELEAPSLKGMFTPKEALEVLLQGSPLKYEFVNDRTVVVQADLRGPRTSIDRSQPLMMTRMDSRYQ